MQFAVCSILIPFTRYLDEYKIYLEKATPAKISNNFFLKCTFLLYSQMVTTDIWLAEVSNSKC